MFKNIFFEPKSGRVILISILSVIGVCLPITALSPPALGFTLDSKGELSANCDAGSLASHTFDRPALKATYFFNGQCVESSGSSVANRWYKITATWNGSTMTATEDLSVTFSLPARSSNSHFAGSLGYNCPDDPWHNNVNCKITAKAGDIFKYFQPSQYPISANFISTSQKQSLKTEWQQASGFENASGTNHPVSFPQAVLFGPGDGSDQSQTRS